MESRIHKRVSTTMSPTEHCHPSNHGCCSHRYTGVLVGLPWELPWASGSQQAGRGEAGHGRWRCVERPGGEGPWSSSLGPPCALDPGNGQTPAALWAGPVTSRPVEGGNSAGACRGHAGLREHWGPQPTQGQREEGVVKQTRFNNILMCVYARPVAFFWAILSQWATWGIVAEYNMMIEWEGSQKFFHWEYVIVLWMRAKDAFVFQGGCTIWKRGAEHQHTQCPVQSWFTMLMI